MKVIEPMLAFKKLTFGRDYFVDEVLKEVASKNLWNLWVPKVYGGMEVSLLQGLEALRILAQIDGSLGWTVTLCSGANFFVGNLKTTVAKEIFLGSQKPIFGGSGGVSGIAERHGEGYVVSGEWRYATGAPLLTHFTLNAKIWESGREVVDTNGEPIVRSFVLPSKQVQIIEDWKTMGLKATATHSFAVRSEWVHAKYSFLYDKLYLPHRIFKVPFSLFADLTLWVNYIGMAEHFLMEAHKQKRTGNSLKGLESLLHEELGVLQDYAHQIQKKINNAQDIPIPWKTKIHQRASGSVPSISKAIIGMYPKLGVRAAGNGHPLNRVFLDYFTATQHHIFHQE